MSVQNLLTDLGMHGRLIDDEFWSKCPYHNDNRPSWSVNLHSGLHSCFSCGAKGNLASLVQHLVPISYTEAVLLANKEIGFARIDKWREDVDESHFAPQSIKVSEVDLAMFTEPPEEQLNLKNITKEAARYFEIKWNQENETWICPYRDPYSNELWGWQEKNNRMFRNYPQGTTRSRTLFGYKQLESGPSQSAPRGKGIAVLLESPLDCAVLYSAGFFNGVATFGVPHGTYQLSLVAEKCSTIVLAMDNDHAGKTATAMLLPEAQRIFNDVKVMDYLGHNDIKDIGDLTWKNIERFMDGVIPSLNWQRKNRYHFIKENLND